MPNAEERINALANYLEVDPSTIQVAGDYTDNIYETEDGEEYWVGNEDEAREATKEDIENFIDDLGIEGFTPSFQDWIYENAIDLDLEDFVLEDYLSYAKDIEDEPDDEYGTRLAAECVEAGLISEEDFENGEYTGDEDLEELLGQHLAGQVDNYVEWVVNNFGSDYLKDFLDKYGYGSIDYDAITDEAISWDGIAHFLARYDGEEIELEDGLYAYRQN